MAFFDLSLVQRLALVVVSSAVVLPANMLDSMLGSGTYVFVLSWWEIIHGLAFGGLVMAPFIDTRLNRRVRVVALMLASVLIYKIAILSIDYVERLPVGELIGMSIVGLIGSALTALATRYIGKLRVVPFYWVSTAFAGAIGGAAFHFLFAFCAWDTCDSVLDAVFFTGGWFVWQGLVCIAIYTGRDRSNLIRD